MRFRSLYKTRSTYFTLAKRTNNPTRLCTTAPIMMILDKGGILSWRSKLITISTSGMWVVILEFLVLLHHPSCVLPYVWIKQRWKDNIVRKYIYIKWICKQAYEFISSIFGFTFAWHILFSGDTDKRKPIKLVNSRNKNKTKQLFYYQKKLLTLWLLYFYRN